MLFMIKDLYYYYEYVNMHLVCTYNMARYYFHIVILSVFHIQNSMYFFSKAPHIYLSHTITLQRRFPPNLFLAIVNTHVEMCQANYSMWLCIYIPYKYKCK